LIDERIIAEDLAARDTRPPRTSVVVACCVVTLALAWLCPRSASSTTKEVQDYLARAHSPENVSVVTDSSSPRDNFASSKYANIEMKKFNAVAEESEASLQKETNSKYASIALKKDSFIAKESENSLPRRDELVSQQIRNFKEKRAIMIAVEDGAGTYMCDYMRHVGNIPHQDFSCSHGASGPLVYNNTAERVALAWHDGTDPMSEVNWEDPHIVSIFVMPNPFDLIQASRKSLEGTNHVRRKSGKSSEGVAHSSTSSHSTLHRLTGVMCDDRGGNITESCFVEAKHALKRFTFVLNRECLAESVSALAKVLELPDPGTYHAHRNERVQERTSRTEPNDFAFQRIQRDIELYEWSRSLSLVRCELLPTVLR